VCSGYTQRAYCSCVNRVELVPTRILRFLCNRRLSQRCNRQHDDKHKHAASSSKQPRPRSCSTTASSKQNMRWPGCSRRSHLPWHSWLARSVQPMQLRYASVSAADDAPNLARQCRLQNSKCKYQFSVSNTCT
jgi:hypothetical protein